MGFPRVVRGSDASVLPKIDVRKFISCLIKADTFKTLNYFNLKANIMKTYDKCMMTSWKTG